jgi:4-methyl-5(b-hydroxyethyl)-thiazole monophosphate biosynthesis
MAKALVLLATGFEEIEAVSIIDILRRANIDVTSASLGEKNVVGAHGITVLADKKLEAIGSTQYDVVVLPGGQPGSNNLRDDARVLKLLREQHAAGRFVAAICAAPIALEAAGLLKGKAATSYPGYDLPSAKYSTERVVVDGHVVTSRAPSTAIEFSLAIVEWLENPSVANKLREAMLVTKH